MIGALLAFTVLTADLETVLDTPALSNSLVSVCVLNSDGQITFDRNAHTRVIPASNQKVFTCAYALAKLGPDTTIKTRFWKISEGVIVDAPGDPTFGAAQLKEVRRQLGLKEGQDVYVRQAFRPGIPATWEWDDLPYRYAPMIHAFTTDFSAFEVWGSGGKVEPLPKELNIQVKRGSTSGARKLTFNRWSGTLQVDGALPQGRTLLSRFATPNPAQTAAAWLGGKLRTWNGDPPDRKPDFVLESDPIRQIVKDCLEPSDNMLAEHLLLMAAASEGPLDDDPYGTASQRMTKFLVEEVGLDEGQVKPIDGSGLSRHNMATGYAIAKTLYWANQQPFARDFRIGLAAPGEGTLSTRLKGIPFAGKTGTISAVSSLSGILNPESDKNPKYICLLFNQFDRPAREMREIQDRFVAECLNQETANEAAGNQAPLQDIHAHPDAGRPDADRLY